MDTTDLSVLRGWKARIDATFRTNQAAGATAKGLSRQADGRLLDGNLDTNLNLSTDNSTTIVELT
ncbi:hypothetical protein A6C57_26660 (plasmid) [Fibrella sp. ES10-3-2-2]